MQPDLRTLGVVQLCDDLDGQVEWYQDVLVQRVLHDARSNGDSLVDLVDHTSDGRGDLA